MARCPWHYRGFKDFVDAAIARLVSPIWASMLLLTWYCLPVQAYLPQWGARWMSWRCEAVNALLSAPRFLLARLWEYLYTPPCNHHRCQLRRYMSPPPPPQQPWYMYLKRFYRPIGWACSTVWPRARPQQDTDASAFLRLPVELRNMIYLYASGASGYRIQYVHWCCLGQFDLNSGNGSSHHPLTNAQLCRFSSLSSPQRAKRRCHILPSHRRPNTCPAWSLSADQLTLGLQSNIPRSTPTVPLYNVIRSSSLDSQ